MTELILLIGKKLKRVKLLNHLILLFISVLISVPLFWMIITSLKSSSEYFSNTFAILPREFSFLSNVQEVWSRAPFTKYYWNTIIFVFGLLVVQLIIAIPAAYTFARLKFPGRDILFTLVLAKMMLTSESVILPNYLIISGLKLLDTKLAIALPYFSSALAVFLFRQALKQIPQEIEDAALIDGCSDFQFIMYIAVPLIKPTITAFSIISVVAHWNEFFWPMIVTETAKSRTLAIGLAMFGLKAETGAEWTLTMTATIITIAPIIVSFLFFSKVFINSFIRSGIK